MKPILNEISFRIFMIILIPLKIGHENAEFYSQVLFSFWFFGSLFVSPIGSVAKKNTKDEK